MLKIEAAKDDRTEKEILEVEEFWGEKAPAYPGWEWVEVPAEVRKKVSSYHRMARLQLEAPPVDWNAPETSLGIRDAVDGHSHLAGYPSHPDKMEELERTLDRAGVKYIINLSLEVYWDEYLREVEQGWLKSRLANRVVNLTTFDWTLDEQGWVERACRHLDRSKKLNVRGVKVHKALGVDVQTHGKRARLNDTRVKELFSHAGELGMPIWIHYGDPWMFLMPLEGNERLREISCFPDWHLYAKNFTDKDAWRLHEDFFELVESTPRTNYNAVHFANYPWDRIDEFFRILEKTPNLYSDISGRMAETGRGKWLGQARDSRAAKTRELINRMPHKLIWGTDMLPTDKLYKVWSLYLRSTKKDIDYTFASFYPGQGDWLVDGLGLEKPVLEKFCRDVAKGLLGLD